MLAAALALLCACGNARSQDQASDSSIVLTLVFRGLTEPVYLTALPGDERVFIVEQAGRIVIGRDGRTDQVFLDIRGRVGSGGERGLLSMAFHPRFRDNGRVFVNYTGRDGHTNVSEFRADTAATAADPASERRLLLVRQPYANHNGGHILFGPDGRLYVGMGDGGAANDPAGNAQNPRELLGKLLRLDVDGAGRGIEGSRDGRTEPAPEIWAVGLRNPWRFWFDSGLVYVADVGQNRWEEINVAPADSAGINYGWKTMEGAHCRLNPVCSRASLHLPAAEYGRGDGCSVIGGVVYRGSGVPALRGHYLYSDWCQGWLRSFRYATGAASDARRWNAGEVGSVVSFGVDGRGEVYLLAGSGTVFRIDARQTLH